MVSWTSEKQQANQAVQFEVDKKVPDSADLTPTEWPIELLRALAATMVMAAHYLPPFRAEFGLEGVYPVWFFYTGVNLFFVLTGYVFAPHLLGGVGDLAAYSTRRFFRIYPMYALSLGFYIGLCAWAGRPIEYVAEHLLFLQTTSAREIAGYYNIALWSLPPEVEYYGVLPLLAALMVKRLLRLWQLTMIAVALNLWVTATLPKTTEPATIWLILSVHLPGILSEFLIGAVAWRTARKGLPKEAYAWLLLVGVMGWTGLAAVFDASEGKSQGFLSTFGTALAGHYGLLASVAFGFVVSGLVGYLKATGAGSSKLRAVSVFAGGLTYGIYLLHNGVSTALAPARRLLGSAGYVLACAAATVMVAYLCSRLLEMPLRNVGRRLSQQFASGPPTRR